MIGRKAPMIARNGRAHKQSRNSHGINAKANTDPSMIAIALAHATQRLKNEVFMNVDYY